MTVMLRIVEKARTKRQRFGAKRPTKRLIVFSFCSFYEWTRIPSGLLIDPIMSHICHHYIFLSKQPLDPLTNTKYEVRDEHKELCRPRPYRSAHLQSRWNYQMPATH